MQLVKELNAEIGYHEKATSVLPILLRKVMEIYYAHFSGSLISLVRRGITGFY